MNYLLIGFNMILVYWLGYSMGYRRGLHRWMDEVWKCTSDLSMYGTSFMKAGKRIDPKKVMKP